MLKAVSFALKSLGFKIQLSSRNIIPFPRPELCSFGGRNFSISKQNFPDFYKVLGIPKSADQSTIKAAYKRKAALWHPDRNPHTSDLARLKTFPWLLISLFTLIAPRPILILFVFKQDASSKKSPWLTKC
jgi:hypothetical protein